MRLRPTSIWLATLLAVVATACSGVTETPVYLHLQDTYEPVSEEIAGAYEDSYAWRSADPVDATADDIAAAVPPVDEVVEENRSFLAYENLVVAVTPEETGGSIVHLDDEERGYQRWYGFVGPLWAPYYGPSGTFRGGGPGFGK